MIFMMEKIVKIPVFSLVIIITLICHTHASNHNRIPHHKVRHKHNILHFNDDHVNEIREAFDDYKNTLHKPKVSKVSFDEAIKVKSLRNHREYDQRLSDDLTQSAIVNDESSSKHFMTRYKRVHTTESTSQGKAADSNYDEEYDDETEDKSSSRNTNALKVQETETAGPTLTERKLQLLSTHEGVQRSFEQETKNQQNNQQEITTNYDQAAIFRLIRENIMRTKIDGMCRWPNKKVIEMPQHASKMYTPRKYVIYQCSDDTACCGSSEKSCVAKKTEDLVLWFNVRTVNSTSYESLKVQNHTECECLYRNRQSPAHSRTFDTSRVSHALPRTTTRKARTHQCKCPSYFDLEVDNDGTCGCFCRNGKNECRRRYEGKEGFTMSDQRCIKQKYCQQPHCLYGIYSTSTGRCTDKNEKIRRGFQRPIRETKLRF